MIGKGQFDWLLWNLHLIDMQEMVDAGVISDRDYGTWDAFCMDRMGWYLRAPEPMASALFKAILNHRPTLVSVIPSKPSNVVEFPEPARSKSLRGKGKD